MECTSCGEPIDLRDAFCSQCGEVTKHGQPLSQKIGNALFDLSEELGKLVKLVVGFVMDETNRKRVIGGGLAIAFLLIVLTDNPITAGVAGLFDESDVHPQLTEEGLPDFVNYKDDFLSFKTEYFVTGTANIRNFPTSEGTTVIDSFKGGERITAREVRAFDPNSRWFAIEGGGYIWGGNLEGVGKGTDDSSSPSDLAFPDTLQGRWSDRASCNEKALNFVEVSSGEMNVNDRLYSLETAPNSTDWPAEYFAYFSGTTDVHVTSIVVHMSADGRMIAVKEGESGEQLNWLQDEGLLECQGH